MSQPNWHKVKIWYSARHRWSGIVHIAARGKGSAIVTRCGIRAYPQTKKDRASKTYRLFEWGKGRSPVTPTCSTCLQRHRQDMEEINTIGRGGAPSPEPKVTPICEDVGPGLGAAFRAQDEHNAWHDEPVRGCWYCERRDDDA